MIDRRSEGQNSARERRLAGYEREGEPPAGVDMELLCQDRSGTYPLPFPCLWRDGRWINAATGEAIDAEVVGWRPARKA
jgi:hypothetical protein